MALYVIIAAGTVALASLVEAAPAGRRGYRETGMSRQQVFNGLCLFTVFIVLFALSACRMNVGNDYAKYVEFMHLIACGAYEYVPTETGFNLLVAVLYRLGGGRELSACFCSICIFHSMVVFEGNV